MYFLVVLESVVNLKQCFVDSIFSESLESVRNRCIASLYFKNSATFWLSSVPREWDFLILFNYYLHMIKAKILWETDCILDSKEKKMFSQSPLWAGKILFWIMRKPENFSCCLLYKCFHSNKEMEWTKQKIVVCLPKLKRWYWLACMKKCCAAAWPSLVISLNCYEKTLTHPWFCIPRARKKL